MTIDLGFDYIDPEVQKKIAENTPFEDGIVIGNCFYTNEEIEKQRKQNEKKEGG